MYLLLSIFVVLTPELITSGTWILTEADFESLIIFALVTLGLLLYVSKERAFFRVNEERTHLQKKTNAISRDLSESYSYIGEMNRKLDVIQEVIFELPKKTLLKSRRSTDIYRPILDAVKVFARTERAALLVIDTKTRICIEGIGTRFFRQYTVEDLLDAKKSFWIEEKAIIVRSPYAAGGRHVFLILARMTNHTEDMEHLQLLASQALLLFVQNEKKKIKEKKDANRN